MLIRHLLTLLLAISPATCPALKEMTDSLSHGPGVPEVSDPSTTGGTDSISSSVRQWEYHGSYHHALDPLLTYRTALPPDMSFPALQFTPGEASLFRWDSGQITATGRSSQFPGMMQIDSGTLGIYQSAGQFTFYLGGTANKYGYFNGLHTQYGLNGSISYQFSPRLSATVFGDYYFGQPPHMANGMSMPPSMLGFYSRSSFGGYFDYQINEHWGVQTGVQTIRQTGTNRYEAEPIVTPYYKINKKIKIGLPVGQILYHILKR